MTPADPPSSRADRIANLSVAQLRLLGKRNKERSVPAGNIFKREDPHANIFPLSFAQEGLWFLEQLMPRNPSFNWIMAVRFHVSLKGEIWRDIFEELARRHEILRTRYVVQNGSPVQIVDTPSQVPVRIVDLRNFGVEQQEAAVSSFIDEESLRGFDVEKEVLCRFNILQIGANDSVLCSSTHMSIIDAWCRKVFINELAAIARSRLLSLPPLPELPLQYGDYAAWERRTLQGDPLDGLLSYWKNQLQDMPELELPTDYPRRAVQRLSGAMESVLLPKWLTDALKEMGKSERATPFMAFLAVFQILLMLYSNQSDIAVGVPIVNRTSSELEGLLGRFVNTLVLRTRLNASHTFREVLRQVREVTLAGMLHQNLPFELLIRELHVRREPDRTPLVRVAFQVEDIPAAELSTGGLLDRSMVTPIDVKTGASVWDLNLHIFSDWDKPVLDRPEELRAVLYYDCDLFDRSTAVRMLNQYQVLLERLVKSPDTPIAEVPLASGEEHSSSVGQHQMVCAEVAGALLEEPSVVDCAVTIRRDAHLRSQLIAYVVTTGQWMPQSLHRRLQANLPKQLQPSVYVPVTRIPLTPEGSVDWKELEAVEIIDSDLLSRWEQDLRNISGIRELAVVAKDEINEEQGGIKRLHLADLLPREARSGTHPAKMDVGHSQYTAAATRLVVEEDNPATTIAVSEGGPMPVVPDMPVVLVEILERAASRHPDHGALYIGCDGEEQPQSYREIFDDGCRILAGLRAAGCQPGDKIVLQLEKNRDFVRAFWGCILGGFVPVLIGVPASYAQSNAITTKIINAYETLNQPLILANQSASLSITAFAHESGLHGFKLQQVEKLLSFPADRSLHYGDTSDPALLLLTSGSTGKPKIVPLSHRNILTRAAAVAVRHGFSAADTSLNWMPLDHVGGIVMFHLQDVYLGCKQIHVETEAITRSPLMWLDLIDQHRATVTWAPNFAYAMVNSRPHEIALRRWDLSSLHFILNAGEAIVPRTAKKFMELLQPFGLPRTAMRPAWGMSETSSAVTYSSRFLAETTDVTSPFVDVGTPNPGFRLRIIGDGGEVLREGEIGSLQVAGTSVMKGYLNRDDLNSELFHGDEWFGTGDAGYLRDGKLTITGRRKDIIIVNGINCHCHEIEAIVEEIDGLQISYTAACAVRSPQADTDQLAIFFIPNGRRDQAELIRGIRARVAQHTGITPEYVIPVREEDIPRTSIGKIQRSLLKERFESGAFDAVLREIDLQLGNSNTLPDWFYRKSWQPRRPESIRDCYSKGPWLLFMDRLGMGAHLYQELTRSGHSTTTVDIGEEFARTGTHQYRMQPDNHEHYERLFSELADAGMTPQEVVHLWTYAPVQLNRTGLPALDHRLVVGAYSLLEVILQFGGATQEAAGLTVVSSNSQPADGTKDLCYDRAALRGLLRTAKLEMPRLRCRHVDFPMKSLDSVDTEARLLLDELRLSQPDIEVLYSDFLRMVPQLEKVSFNARDRKTIPFKTNGTYLISGGLGGLGRIIAKYLLAQYGARLLILGRTEVPQQRFRELMGAGDIHYEAVDVCDGPAVANAVRRAEVRWRQSFDGVIHLAGTLTPRLLTEESKDSLAAALRTKVRGAEILSEFICGNPEAVFITASSTTTLWGTVGMAAYSSANEALESFTRYLQLRGIRSYCFTWSVWDGVGTGREYQLQWAQRMRGELPISANQGINSFLAGLSHNQQQLIVGLDHTNVHVRRRMGEGGCRRQRIYSYFAADTPLPIEQFKSRVVTDRFKAPTVCEPVQLKELPRNEHGHIDHIQLSADGFLDVSATKVSVPPTTEFERQVAEIWRSVLGTEQLGINDDFFSLGGHSILAVQVMATIRSRFNKDLPLRIFLEKPTVAHLAAALQSSSQPELSSPLVPIQESGTRRPLFMAHPAGGNVLCYQALATELGPEQPFYGLEEGGEGEEEEPARSLEEMAATYCRAIREIQSAGPYLLGGYSLGGVIAFEMARQLGEQGEDVSLLAIIDVEAPGYSHGVVHNFWENSAEGLLSLCKLLEIYTGLRVSISKEDLENQAAEDQIEYVFHEMQRRDLLPAAVDLPYFRRYVRIHQRNVEALMRYTPRQYAGKIVLFRSTEPLPNIAMEQPRTGDSTMGWQRYAVTPVTVRDVPGNHITMMTSPRVRVLATMLQTHLDLCGESKRTSA